MPAQSKNNQVEPHPLKRLPEIPSERLFVKGAEAGQIREVGPAPKSKHCLKQLPQKLALPKANGAIVNVGHLPEHNGYHRRDKRLWEHGP